MRCIAGTGRASIVRTMLRALFTTLLAVAVVAARARTSHA